MKTYLMREGEFWSVFDIETDKFLFAARYRDRAIEWQEWVESGKPPDGFLMEPTVDVSHYPPEDQ